jgi:hypothetical protein
MDVRAWVVLTAIRRQTGRCRFLLLLLLLHPAYCGDNTGNGGGGCGDFHHHGASSLLCLLCLTLLPSERLVLVIAVLPLQSLGQRL